MAHSLFTSFTLEKMCLVLLPDVAFYFPHWSLLFLLQHDWTADMKAAHEWAVWSNVHLHGWNTQWKDVACRFLHYSLSCPSWYNRFYRNPTAVFVSSFCPLFSSLSSVDLPASVGGFAVLSNRNMTSLCCSSAVLCFSCLFGFGCSHPPCSGNPLNTGSYTAWTGHSRMLEGLEW